MSFAPAADRPAAPRAEGTIILPDGRKLSYADFGIPDGQPVLYFHGSPSSRLEPLLLGDDAPGRLGLRLIAPDRPGMGNSDFLPRRRVADWAADAAALADALGLGRFAVLGNSGGAPYVAVCAARIPHRLSAAVIVSGGWRMDWPEAKSHIPFVNRLVFVLARRAPLLLRLVLASMGSVARGEREKELRELRRRVHPADYAVFAEPGRLEAFGLTMREALRQGTRGPAWDMRQYVREFGFGLDEVRMPVTWFHGGRDANSPMGLARRVVSGLPRARLVAFEDDAHLSTLCRHFDEISKTLTAKPP